MNSKISALSITALALVLSGCDTIRNTLGLDHYQADAFAVPTNPPLVLPPDYSLVPPKPGAEPTYQQTAETKAQSTLQTDDAKVHSSSGTEAILVKQTSAAAAPSNIREIVDKEATDESTMAGKLEGQMKSWKEQAKENIASIRGDSDKDKSKEEPTQTSGALK